MKKSILFVFISLIITSIACKKEVRPQPEVDPEQEFIEQNVAIFDARVRTLTGISTIAPAYVRELYLVNFSDEDWDRSIVGFGDDVFVDDGTGYDEVANDGIFTSVDSYLHSNSVPYDGSQIIRSVLEKPIVDENFVHLVQLREFAAQYPIRNNNSGTASSGGSIVVHCHIVTGCKGCVAQEKGWCDSCCICIECDADITLRWDW